MSLIENLNSYFDFVNEIDKESMFYSIITFMGIMFVWENYLSFRQVNNSF